MPTVLYSFQTYFFNQNFLYNCRNKSAFTLLLSTEVNHAKKCNKVNTIKALIGRVRLASQLSRLFEGEDGYEHFFLSYFVYLPYRLPDVTEALKESLDKLEKNKLNDGKALDGVRNAFEAMRLDVENDGSRFINGDYKKRNQKVEIQLSQRSSKKVSYVKREFSQINQLDKII